MKTIKWLLALPAKLKLWGAALATAAAGLLAVWLHGGRAQRDSDEKRRLEDVQNRTEKGRQALQRGRDSGGDAADRVRDNDAKW